MGLVPDLPLLFLIVCFGLVYVCAYVALVVVSNERDISHMEINTMANATETTVRPVVSTSEKTAVNPAATFVNNVPDELIGLDEALADGFQLQSQIPNETDFRIKHLLDAVIAANKGTARANVATYERAIDGMAKLSCYKKTHTRDAVEQIFLQTRDGQVMAGIKKLSAEYLENHK